MPEHEPEPDPPSDPAADARLRALLGTLGSSVDPADAGDLAARMPDDVAARLDARIADLSAERATADRTAPVGTAPWQPPAVDELARQRARRRGRARLLLAAAGVVVVAGVGGTVLHNLGSTADSGAGASSAAKDESVPTPALGATAARTAYSRADFRRQVLADRDPVGGLSGSRLADLPADCSGGRDASPLLQRRAITLDGAPAVLEVSAAEAGRVLVRAVDCSGQRVLAQARVPAP